MSKQRIAYVVNHAAFFVSHRLPLAIGAMHAGHEVALFTGQAGSKEMEAIALEKLVVSGVAHRRTMSRSASMNPLLELFGFLQLVWFLLRYRPTTVHCASPKGVLYGGLAARICGVPNLVLAISGMGYAFTESNKDGRIRVWAKRVFSLFAGLAFAHPNIRVIVQNQDDHSTLISKAWIERSKVTLIPGSGVDLSLFKNIDIYEKKPIVLLPARMLKDKGVLEFVQAAKQVLPHVPNWRFILAGAAGYDNPTAIPELELRQWQTQGEIEWLGHVDDMLPLFKEAAIVCLPSYREGMPKVLLEAAAAACAVVTTDVPGCRDAIVPGVTGDLVPVRDSFRLADTLLSLIKDEVRQKSYSQAGRERAERLFSLDAVVRHTLNIYMELQND